MICTTWIWTLPISLSGRSYSLHDPNLQLWAQNNGRRNFWRSNNGEWGNIPIPTLHEIWFSSSFWVDFLLHQENIIGKRPSQHPTGVWSVQTRSLPFETWGNSTSHTGLGSIWSQRSSKTGRKWTAFNLNLKPMPIFRCTKKIFLKKLHREKGEIHIPLFFWQHLSSTFHRRIEKKMHGSRHSVHSHPPKQDGWFGGDLSLQLSPTISRWAQTKIIHSLVGTEPSSNHPAGLFSRSKCKKKHIKAS